MSWGLGWKRTSEVFHLILNYGDEAENNLTPESKISSSLLNDLGPRIELDWSSADDEEQVTLRLQSQLMVALPSPRDTVIVELNPDKMDAIEVDMKIARRREPLRAITLSKSVGSGQQSDGVGVLSRLLKTSFPILGCGDGVMRSWDHWKSVRVLSLCGCGLTVLHVELIQLPVLERLYLDNNRLSVLPPELGELKNLRVLRVDSNMLISVPVELRQCVQLVELSLEHNKLVRPLLDFRAMSELRILRLFGNPLEFLPEILPLDKLRHLSLANIKIEADEKLKSVTVQIETEVSSYFTASRHKLSAFFSLIFRFSSCHHPLLASALAKIMEDQGNRTAIGKDENAVRQLISMISSENRHVVEQACLALSSLARDGSLVMQLMKCDVMQPVQSVLRSVASEELVSVLQVLVNLAFGFDIVAQKMLTREVLRSLKALCVHKNPEVQRLALLSIGNLAFSLDNRRTLVTSESLRELLLRLTVASEPPVKKAAARALAILGENENLRRAIRGKQVSKEGLRILSMDGGGMKGLATVQMLKRIEQGTGKRIHEIFDLICGTSTGGMLAIALGVKQMTLDHCEEIYKKLGKVVFMEPVPKDNEAATWREKLDQLYKSSSQSFRVVVHGSKHSAENFERLLKEICADEDGDLLIESAVKCIPKVFVVSTLVNMVPAQPFLFRNYQYPPGTPETPLGAPDVATGVAGISTAAYRHREAYMGSCKHQIWQAIRASSAAPYYLDDYSDDVNRWQDGAILANNPTIFAIKEAQMLWPDTHINCLVSIGCGSVPMKARKGGWRYMDTGQVLIESACSVERVEETLEILLPMLPEIKYFRFNPVDERCDMELDETDPAVWLKLENAARDYIDSNSEAFKNACEQLVPSYLNEAKWAEQQIAQTLSTSNGPSKASAAACDGNNLSLGRRRMVLLVLSSCSPDSRKAVQHVKSLESFCANNGIRVSQMDQISMNQIPKTFRSVASSLAPLASPLLTGSFPSSPLVYSPEFGPQRLNKMDLVPPLSLDGNQVEKTISLPTSPSRFKRFPLLVQSLHERLQNLPQVGIVHLALQNDSTGSILSWQNDVFVVAEPGEAAERFLSCVKCGLLSSMQDRSRHNAAISAKIMSLADLVAYCPHFEVGGVFHRYIGRQTHVLEDDQEIGAFMFQRTVPATHLTSEDVRSMFGDWRERIIIYSGKFGPVPSLIKAFLDSGAKAVVGSSVPPPDAQLPFSCELGYFPSLDDGKFEIGNEEAEIESGSSASHASDWEDSDVGDTGSLFKWKDEEDEDDLASLICRIYDALFREGARVDLAVQKAQALHPKLRYTCHLPYSM